jgi:hypothetical protein
VAAAAGVGRHAGTRGLVIRRDRSTQSIALTTFLAIAGKFKPGAVC